MQELVSRVADASRDAARYVEGATAAEGVAFDSPVDVLTESVETVFRDSGELRAIAALSRIEAGETTADLATAADVSPEAAAMHRETYGDRITNDATCESELLAALDVRPKTAERVREVARSGVASEASVVAYAVEYYFQKHEAIRNAAVAARYAESLMTTGRAADLAGVRKGPEIESLLKQHGVEPRVGLSSDPELRRAEARAARRAFGLDDEDESGAADEEPEGDDADRD